MIQKVIVAVAAGFLFAHTAGLLVKDSRGLTLFLRGSSGRGSVGWIYDDKNQISVATIATNGYDPSYLVKTIRQNGLFDGPVYVLSDTHSSPSNSTLVQVQPPSDSLSAVQLKTRVFDILWSLPSEYVLYLDADMGVNAPLDPFFQRIGQYDEGCSIYLLRERYYAKSKWNTGTMLLHREHSAELLREWDYMISANHDLIRSQKKFSKDQYGLMKVLEDPKYKVCELPNEVSFAADFFTHYLWGEHGTTFTHWTSAKRTSGHNFKASV